MFNHNLSFGLSAQTDPSFYPYNRAGPSGPGDQAGVNTSNTAGHSFTPSTTIDPRLFASAATISDTGLDTPSGTTTPTNSAPTTVKPPPPRNTIAKPQGRGSKMWAGPQEATLAQSTPTNNQPIPLDAAPLQEVLRARHERWSRHNGAMELPMATFSSPTSPQQQQIQAQPLYTQMQQTSLQTNNQMAAPLRTQSFNEPTQGYQTQPGMPDQQPFQPEPLRRGRSISTNEYDMLQNQSSRGLRPPQNRASSSTRRSPGADDITTDRSPAIQVSQMSEVELLVAMSRTTLMSGYFTRPIDPPEWMRLLFPDENDLICFHHCIVYSMSIFVVKEDRNPWIEHVVPLILFPTEYAPSSTQAMRLAMLATGATHLAYLEARKAAGSPEALRKRRLALRYRSESVTLLREARHSVVELSSDAFLAATAIMLSNDMLAANSTWREIARLSRFAIHARGGCEQMIKGMTVKNSGQLAVLCVLSQLLVLDLYAVLSSGEMPHLYHGEEWWFQHDGEAPSMFDALLGMSETTVVLAAQALIIWGDSFRIQSRFGEEETARLAFPPESHFIVTQPTPGALDFRITLPRHTPNLTRTFAQTGAPREIEDLARRTRQFLERNEQWHTSDWTNTLEERTQWGSLALYIGQHIMVRRDMYRLPREDKGCQILADVLLRMCLTVGDKMQFFKWPLIIAASVFTDNDRREATRQTLKAFEYQCCYDIAVAQAVIEEMWRRADEGMDDDTCHWKRCFLELGCPVLLY